VLYISQNVTKKLVQRRFSIRLS